MFRPIGTLLAAGTLVFAMACGGDGISYGPEGSPSPLRVVEVPSPGPVERVTYVFGDGVSASTQSLVTTWVGHAGDTMSAEVGLDRSRPFTVALVPGSSAANLPAFTTIDRITIDPRNPIWTRDGGDGSPGVLAHEYVHLWQYQYGCLGDGSGTPMWMYEGMAQYLSYQTVFRFGQASQRASELALASRMRAAQVYLHLDQLERAFPEYANPYDVAYFAVKLLAQKQGVKALGTLCANARAYGWNTAFGTLYGETPQAFYAEFEAYRKTL